MADAVPRPLDGRPQRRLVAVDRDLGRVRRQVDTGGGDAGHSFQRPADRTDAVVARHPRDRQREGSSHGRIIVACRGRGVGVSWPDHARRRPLRLDRLHDDALSRRQAPPRVPPRRRLEGRGQDAPEGPDRRRRRRARAAPSRIRPGEGPTGPLAHPRDVRHQARPPGVRLPARARRRQGPRAGRDLPARSRPRLRRHRRHRRGRLRPRSRRRLPARFRRPVRPEGVRRPGPGDARLRPSSRRRDHQGQGFQQLPDLRRRGVDAG